MADDDWLEAAYEDRTHIEEDEEVAEFLTLTPEEMEQFDELEDEFCTAGEDVIGDGNAEGWEGGGWAEVARSLAARYPERVRHEFLRQQGLPING